MGLMESGVARTRASASDARADLAETKSKMHTAEAKMRMAAAADDTVSSVSRSWLGRQRPLRPLLQGLASQTAALRSRAVADVDELTARREAAASRLRLAEKSQNAMQRIAEETDKVLGD